MNKIVAATACSLFLGSTLAIGCVDPGNPVAPATESQGVAEPTPPETSHDENESQSGGESSPFVVGDWKFPETQCDSGSTITADTEFRFINPTDRTFTIEYAFFELDGTFCGCDRDDIDSNATVLYTIAQEVEGGFFTCSGRSGALKSIFFKIRDGKLVLDGAEQVGFQTHAFASANGEIVEPDPNIPSDFLVGPIMTEAGLEGVVINDRTFADILKIHAQCADFLGPIGN